MSRYVANLLDYRDAGLVLADISSRPVPRELLEKIHKCCSLEQVLQKEKKEKKEQKEPLRIIEGTNICMIRGGVLIYRVSPEDGWGVLVGRECGSVDEISPQAPLKTPGGYLKFSMRDERSVKSAVFREMRKEENFRGKFGILPGSIVPMDVFFARPHGALHFYSGKLKNNIKVKNREMYTFREPTEKGDDGLFVTYYSINDAVDSLLDMENALIRKETADVIMEAYFWKPCRQIRFKKEDFAGYVNGGGNLKIKPAVREDIFHKTGIRTSSDFLDECEVYYTVNIHTNMPVGAKLYLSTDLFMYKHEFGPEELRIFYNPDKTSWMVAEECVKTYLKNNYTDILTKDLYEPYIFKEGEEDKAESHAKHHVDGFGIYRMLQFSGHSSGPGVAVASKKK